MSAWQSWSSYRADEIWTLELPRGGDLPWALFYPADYSIGAANLGIHYIFRILKENGVAAERFFSSPISYRSVDADTMMERFPIITAGISYEGGFVTFCEWLKGANIPLSPYEREKNSYPILGVGGAISYINPLLVSGISDFVVLGDAVDILPYIIECMREYMSCGDRRRLWNKLAENEYILVPPLHLSGGGVEPRKLGRSIPIDDTYPMYSSWVTPRGAFGNTLLTELQRGCARSCSYCTLPGSFGKMRYRKFDIIKPELDRILPLSGAAQIGLVTPEAGDYPDIEKLLYYIKSKNIGVSFASLRLDRLTEQMIDALTSGGRHSITVAPESGSDSLRFSCGKKFTNDLIIEKLIMAKSKGIDQVKLYFMLGLPGETEEHVAAIADLSSRIIDITGQNLILSVNPFIPKPGTPWKNESFAGIPQIRKKYNILSSAVRAIKKKTPQLRITSPKEADTEYNLAWFGYNDSINISLADSFSEYLKKCRSSQQKTLLDLKSLFPDK